MPPEHPLYRYARFFSNWKRSTTWTACAAPSLAPTADSSSRSRLITATLGCARNQAAKLLADRSGSRSASGVVPDPRGSSRR